MGRKRKGIVTIRILNLFGAKVLCFKDPCAYLRGIISRNGILVF